MKNVREYYAQCLKSEKKAFINVIKAVPPDKGDYKPHPRSTSSGDLVWLLATELDDACKLIDHGDVNYVVRPSPGVNESIAAYEKHIAALEERVAEARRCEVGQQGATHDGRQGGVGNHAWRHAVRVPFRRRSSPRTALELFAADGREGPVDLRAVGRRPRK